MKKKRFRRVVSALLSICFGFNQMGVAFAAPTRSPIKHVIVVVGENRSFDNLFATYTPPDPTQTVFNLLSEGIVDETGFPPGLFGGSSFVPSQNQATDTDKYRLSPTQTGPFASLPQPSTGLNGLPSSPCLLSTLSLALGVGFAATCTDVGLAPEDQFLLSLGGMRQPLEIDREGLSPVPDCRYFLLQPGSGSGTAPFPLPNSPYPVVNPGELLHVLTDVPLFDSTQCVSLGSPGDPLYGLGTPVSPPTATEVTDHAGDPAHRFFQMWQQADCNVANATAANPSGCLHDLVTWVGITQGWGVTGTCKPDLGGPYQCPPPTDDESTYQGGVAMGIYNMAAGELPILQSFAQNYALSDNYHQPSMGGTGPNSQAIFTGDVYYFADPNGTGNPIAPEIHLVANPDPVAGTNNFYTEDTLPHTDQGSTSFGGATNCSDVTQPGVSAIVNYEKQLSYKTFNSGNCAPNTYYQINNEYPAYDHLGNPIATSPTQANEFPAGAAFSIGPQTIPTIADALSRKKITWKYYGDGYNAAGDKDPASQLYCSICNGLQYSRSIMTTSLKNNIQDLGSFYEDVRNNNLPAVSFIKPSTLLDGHPGTSTPALFEAFARNIVETVQGNPKLWSSTAILLTFDESGGEYDSGYIQPIDFFGDGPRTVMLAISPFSKFGFVDHTYADHASILKFIEWNWKLKPLSKRSRDNLPNPKTTTTVPYVPINSPAIGDLRNMFDFRRRR
jgi:phospholipase C